jgi:hypothetical protein
MRDKLARSEKQQQQDAGMDAGIHALAAEQLDKVNEELRKAQNDAGEAQAEAQAEVSSALHARGLRYASPEES